MSNLKDSTGNGSRTGGIARLWRATIYSLDGLRASYRNEAAFRQEVWLAMVLVPASLLMPISFLFRTFLVACMMLVLVVELLNSAVEAVVDLVSPDFHPLAKKAKDMGSAAVLVSLLILAVAWGAALFSVVRYPG